MMTTGNLFANSTFFNNICSSRPINNILIWCFSNCHNTLRTTWIYIIFFIGISGNSSSCTKSNISIMILIEFNYILIFQICECIKINMNSISIAHSHNIFHFFLEHTFLNLFIWFDKFFIFNISCMFNVFQFIKINTVVFSDIISM